MKTAEDTVDSKSQMSVEVVLDGISYSWLELQAWWQMRGHSISSTVLLAPYWSGYKC
jgi:hypothetical protein